MSTNTPVFDLFRGRYNLRELQVPKRKPNEVLPPNDNYNDYVCSIDGGGENPRKNTIGNKKQGATDTSAKPELDSQEQTCICNRPMCRLLCTLCKQSIYGRISRQCQIHPKTIYLQDITMCPFCKPTFKPQQNLMEISEGILATLNSVKR